MSSIDHLADLRMSEYSSDDLALAHEISDLLRLPDGTDLKPVAAVIRCHLNGAAKTPEKSDITKLKFPTDEQVDNAWLLIADLVEDKRAAKAIVTVILNKDRILGYGRL